MRKVTYYMTDRVFTGLRKWQREIEIKTEKWPNTSRAINTILEATLGSLGYIDIMGEDGGAETEKLETLTFLAKCTGETRRCGTV